MQCELCGKDCGEACRPGLIEGVKMMLCPSCMKHGKGVKSSSGTENRIQRSLIRRKRRSQQKDVYEKMNKEIIPHWGEVVRKARKEKGLTREKLGFNIGERTVTISKIENDELRPSDKVAEKLEKELSISLFEEVKKVKPPKPIFTQKNDSGLTLGDFIKTED